MFNRFTRVATAAVGAVVLSTLSIAAAVGPVGAAARTPAQVASAQAGAAHA
ncbi:MAG: hypothetical protein QOJ53_273 [Sphingomonadales bacterium]|jgi:hypothetical protein|nr:hypothetical protein [Sphingomonadales bacterium]MEA3044266.1 hypothetical protein [Sphingomonadales bacterium]MEA3045941.1 hypothetical protein [Sphingomonadales bacterium]